MAVLDKNRWAVDKRKNRVETEIQKVAWRIQKQCKTRILRTQCEDAWRKFATIQLISPSLDTYEF